MKRIIAAACFLFGFGMLSAQISVPIPQREAHGTFSATGSSSVIDQQGTGVGYHRLTWKLGGTVPATTCTIKIEKSDDNVTFADGFTAVNCADGQTRLKDWTFFSARYIKITLVTFSGGTAPSIDYEYVGSVSNPLAGGEVTQGTSPWVVGDGAGAMNVIVDSGTVTAVTAITNALPAGTNAIGKLAANSGVDIGDVDVLSLPSVTIGTFPDNEPVNVAQINGVAATMGNGISGTGVQRVTLASDSTGQVTLAAGANTIGTVTANAGTGTFIVGDGAGALNTIVDSGTITANAGTGTFTVDSELPAATVLTDDFANPTPPAVGAFALIWDGATWDRWTGAVTGTVTANAGTGTFIVGDGAGALNTIIDSGTVTANAGTGTFVVGDGAGALNTIVDSITAGDNNIGNVDIVTLPALVAGTAAIGKLAANSGVDIGDVDILSIAAGDNNIGNVDVVTLPALSAGANNIGDVDVLTLPAIPTGTNAIGTVQPGNTQNTTAWLVQSPCPTGSVDEQTTAITTTAETSIADLVASERHHITAIDITASTAVSFTATLKDSVAGATRAVWHIKDASNGFVKGNGSGIILRQKAAQNNSWTLTLSASSVTVAVNVTFCKDTS